MISIFNRSDWIVFGVLFLISIPYAIILEQWSKRFPQSFDTLTWLQVVIGVIYIMVGLAFILPLEAWLRVAMAFFFASLAIITRSVVIHSLNQRSVEEIDDGLK